MRGGPAHPPLELLPLLLNVLLQCLDLLAKMALLQTLKRGIERSFVAFETLTIKSTIRPEPRYQAVERKVWPRVNQSLECAGVYRGSSARRL
jgi:hypothetical protein